MSLLERLSAAGIFAIDFDIAEPSSADSKKIADYRKLADTYLSSEKMLAEIFFSLTLGLAKMSELGIAHTNINPGNIFLDNCFCPYLSHFEAAEEYASPELLAQDLKDLGQTMVESIESHSNQDSQNNQNSWVASISNSTTLIDLRKNLFELATKTAAGEISMVDELLNALIGAHSEVLFENSQEYLAPAIPTSSLD